MSADNWAICPRCVVNARAAKAEQRTDAADQHGKIAAEEWQALAELAAQELDEEPCRTFREDYEIYGAEEGVIHVRYQGKCTACGSGTTFEMEHEIP